jgi:hypothetical protein
MSIADVLAALAALAIAGAGFPALVTLVHLILPACTVNSADRLRVGPLRSIACGTAVAVGALLAATALGNALAGPGKLLGAMLLLGTLAVAAVGAAGLATVVARAAAGAASGRPSVRGVIHGAVLLELACALPIVGWFVVAPAAFLASLGAGTLALHSRVPRPTGMAPTHAVGFDAEP